MAPLFVQTVRSRGLPGRAGVYKRFWRNFNPYVVAACYLPRGHDPSDPLCPINLMAKKARERSYGAVELIGVSKSFGSVQVCRGYGSGRVNERRRMICLIGPSGSGQIHRSLCGESIFL